MSQLLDRLESPESKPPKSLGKGSKRVRRSGLIAGRAAVLPGSRAILGALLCSLAALLTFGAYANANRPPKTKYYVAARNLEPGAVIQSKDVELVALDLPEQLRRRIVGPSVSLEDAVVLGPVGKGELLQLGNVIKKTGGSEARELSFPIDSAFAAAGRLRPGDRVDVYANRGDEAVPIAVNLLIIATSSSPDGVSSGRGTIVLTVSYDGTFDGAALLGAAQSTKLSLIRRTGIAGDIRRRAGAPASASTRPDNAEPSTVTPPVANGNTGNP